MFKHHNHIEGHLPWKQGQLGLAYLDSDETPPTEGETTPTFLHHEAKSSNAQLSERISLGMNVRVSVSMHILTGNKFFKKKRNKVRM